MAIALTGEEIEQHPLIRTVLRARAFALLELHVANPRAAGIFATHQRWLLAHIALTAHFEAGASQDRHDASAGIYASTFAATAVAQAVSSRNTAEAFLREMVIYGFMQSETSARDRRIRWLSITPYGLANVVGWLSSNLATLDALDNGDRAAQFRDDPSLIAVAEPTIARDFLGSPEIRNPDPLFLLFTTVDEGGAVMDRLFASHAEMPDGEGRYFTGIASIADFGGHIRLSRSHLTRKLATAEALGGLGWEGVRGKSRIWVSDAFVRAYVRRQAAELAAIDAGFLRALEAALVSGASV